MNSEGDTSEAFLDQFVDALGTFDKSDEQVLLMQHFGNMPLADMAAYHRASEGTIRRMLEELLKSH